MILNINIEKSIERRRIIAFFWITRISDYFIFSVFAIVFITCIIGPTIGVAIEITATKIVWISLLLLLYIITIYNLYRMDSLEVIDNINSEFDKEFFISIAKDNEWSLVRKSDKILIFRTKNGLGHERQITFIINYKSVFINVMSFGNLDLKSPIYRRKDRIILTQIIKKIKSNAA